MRATWAIIRWNVWQRRWSLMWWSVGIIVYMLITISVYPSFKDNSQSLNQSLANLPAATKALFSDTASFASPIGYLSSKVYYFMLPLLFSILSITLGASLIGKEEDSTTIELLLSRPISRGKLLLGKAVAGLAIMFAIGLVTCAIAVPLVTWAGFDGVSSQNIVLATAVSLTLGILFGTLTFMLTAIGHKVATASTGVAVLVALGGYVIASLDQTVKWLRWPAKVLPYHYYHPSELLAGTFTINEFIGFIVAIVALGTIAWLAFRRRDISS